MPWNALQKRKLFNFDLADKYIATDLSTFPSPPLLSPTNNY